ncbi:hypothetical protein CLOP_g17287 [Closterium sp. NIES-67]|nr:hypothetical protein CLOP_g17287 [Closterium sp. NIES-67]
MLSRIASSLRQSVQRLTRGGGPAVFAGTDEAGNKYFYEPAEDSESRPNAAERRWVEYRDQQDPTKLPVEWSSWLSRSRRHAPTPDEMAALAQHRAIVKQRAKLWEEEEERRRFREKSLQHDIQRHEGAEDLDAEGAARMAHRLSQAMLHRVRSATPCPPPPTASNPPSGAPHPPPPTTPN